MKFRIQQHNVKLFITSLSFSILTACGGGGGGSEPKPAVTSSSAVIVSSVSSISSTSLSSLSTNSDSSSSAISSSVVSSNSLSSVTSSSSSSTDSSLVSSSSAVPPLLSGEAVLYATTGELLDSSEMPSPLAKVTDSLTHDSLAVTDAESGLFKYGKTYVISLGGGGSDCPSSGQISCPYFERVKISSAGVLSTTKYAYYPIQKKWVALSVSQVGLGFSADSTFDGNSWSSSLPLLIPKSSSVTTGPWSYSYGSGDVEYQLSLMSSSLFGQQISGAQGVTYPSGAKSLSFQIEQTSGVFYTLSEGGFWGNSDDGAVYQSTASLRTAHSSVDAPLCLEQFDVSALVYFDPQVHAAGFADGFGICAASITDFSKITAVESGVITLANRAVIGLQIPDNFFTGKTAREKQKIAIVGLDFESGKASNGVAYFPGYTVSKTGYANEAAFKAWLNTVTTDVEAQTIP